MDTISAVIGIAALVLWIKTRHPFFCLPLLVAGSLLLEDDAYPFSHFPMYSDPDESENYLYLAKPDADGEPEALAVRTLTGLTAPKVKKMYKRYLQDHAKERGIRDSELSDEERAVIGREILAYYREQGEERGSEMPDELMLMEVWIEFDAEGRSFSETTSTIARQTAEAEAEASSPE